jgi:hypothetical protein
VLSHGRIPCARERLYASPSSEIVRARQIAGYIFEQPCTLLNTRLASDDK